jgi:hypothetical protein
MMNTDVPRTTSALAELTTNAGRAQGPDALAEQRRAVRTVLELEYGAEHWPTQNGLDNPESDRASTALAIGATQLAAARPSNLDRYIASNGLDEIAPGIKEAQVPRPSMRCARWAMRGASARKPCTRVRSSPLGAGGGQQARRTRPAAGPDPGPTHTRLIVTQNN